MKNSLRVILVLLCVLMILSAAVIIPSPLLITDGLESGESGRFIWFPASASAESETSLVRRDLPMDFTPGMPLDPSGVTEDGYSDDSIEVKLTTREENSVVWRVIDVRIGSPTQLRTATAGKLTSSKTAHPSRMAEANNAVAAINGDYFSKDPQKTTFEYRMGQKIREKTNRKKDVLIIDENGDFHTFVKFTDMRMLDRFYEEGHQIMQAFTFGPVLVQDYLRLAMDQEYGYNPTGKEPRAAIGQIGSLHYVLVVAEGRSDDSKGVTHQELADFMYDLGCIEAFNLDGGNSATLIFNNGFFMGNRSFGNERDQSDIIYFASTAGME